MSVTEVKPFVIESKFPLFLDLVPKNWEFNFLNYLGILATVTAINFKNHFGFSLDRDKFYQDFSTSISKDVMIENLEKLKEIKTACFYLYKATVMETEEGYSFQISIKLYSGKAETAKKVWEVNTRVRGVLGEVVNPGL